MSDEEVDVQPSGEVIEQTLSVVSHILTDFEFAQDVIEHNEWTAGLGQHEVAVLFLASRYQEAVTLLSLQTSTLKRELDGLTTRLVDLEDRISG